MCRRPAVSTISTSAPRACADLTASNATAPGSAPAILRDEVRARARSAQTSSCSPAAARNVSDAARLTRLPSADERARELADRGGLPGAVDADHEDDVAPRRAGRRAGLRAEHRERPRRAASSTGSVARRVVGAQPRRRGRPLARGPTSALSSSVLQRRPDVAVGSGAEDRADHARRARSARNPPAEAAVGAAGGCRRVRSGACGAGRPLRRRDAAPRARPTTTTISDDEQNDQERGHGAVSLPEGSPTPARRRRARRRPTTAPRTPRRFALGSRERPSSAASVPAAGATTLVVPSVLSEMP